MTTDPQGSTNNKSNEAWWLILFRHFSTVVAMIAIFWWLALPRVEGFIQSAVNDRILRLEVNQDANSKQLSTILEKLTNMQKEFEAIKEERNQ